MIENEDILLKINNLNVDFKIKNKLFGKPDTLSAVNNVSFSVKRGETFGLVGESGCGKTTLANTVLGFVGISEGSIEFDGVTLNKTTDKKIWSKARAEMQLVFQDPFSSLNPRFEVWRLISEPLRIRGEKSDEVLKKAAADLIEKVGLNSSDLYRNIFEFSGGQRQRIAIARALTLKPKLIVLDEPVSALDVSVHSQICNLLIDLQKEFNLTYLFISHNLSVIKHMTQHMAVMYLGQLAELGSTEKIFNSPAHPYTKALMSAILEVSGKNPERIILNGEVASPINVGGGCRFFSRCNFATQACSSCDVTLRGENDHFTACPFFDIEK